MKLYTLPDGSTVKATEQFQIGDQRYPAGWLQLAPLEDIKKIGIYISDVPDPIPDPPAPKDLAQLALDASDMTALRCFKAGIPFPIEWLTYTNDLRTVLRNNAGKLPVRPSFPVGT